MRARLIAFGKLKTPGLREAADYYLKLVRPWSALEEIELKPAHLSDKSEALRRQCQISEQEMLRKTVSRPQGRASGTTRQRVYYLDEKAKPLSTLEWAEHVRRWKDDSLQDLVFCLGSSVGFHEDFRRECHGAFSLGPQTLSHELARVVFLEQYYRAWSVVQGHPYHNEGA
ncbi:MAG: 23S rRNA (pseudouridine(1915)-N(3))-methyltransferase RlmH [Bacteriovoracia bacterium]